MSLSNVKISSQVELPENNNRSKGIGPYLVSQKTSTGKLNPQQHKSEIASLYISPFKHVNHRPSVGNNL